MAAHTQYRRYAVDFTDYPSNVVYAADIPQYPYRNCPDRLYLNIVDQFPDDPVGYRRLVERDFTKFRGISVCIEYTVARVAANDQPSDWSFDVTLFRTHTVPPVCWNEYNVEPHLSFEDYNRLEDMMNNGQDASLFLFVEEEDNELAQRNRIQNALSRIPAE